MQPRAARIPATTHTGLTATTRFAGHVRRKLFQGQGAEGLTYGVVPYVSHPTLDIVTGMVGAGGNLGSMTP